MLSLFQFIRSPSSSTLLLAWKNHLEINPEIHVVERLAAAVVTLQFLQFICHRVRFWGRRHWSLRWGAFYLPVPLSAMAVAVMMLRSTPPYWLVAIFFAAGQADTMAAYSLREEDDKRSVRRFAKRALYMAYLSVLYFVYHRDGPTSHRHHLRLRRKETLSLALGFFVVLQDLRISSRAKAPSSEICKIAADHVRFSQNRAATTFSSDDDDGDDEPYQPPAAPPSVVAVGSLESYRSAVSGCVTLEDIRRVMGSNSNSRLEDACLSSALFLQLLQRQHHRVLMVKEKEPSSANHAFKERLPQFLGLDWAFERVEAQLSFMRDYFFSVHGSPSRTSDSLYLTYSILKISFLLTVRSLMFEEEQGRLTRATLYALILLELCHLVGYLRSDGCLVSSICDLLKRDQDQLSSVAAAGAETSIESVLRTLFSAVLKLLGWKSRVYLGQYSLVDDLCCKPGLKQRLMTMMGIRRRPLQKETVTDHRLWGWIGGKAISPVPGRFAFRVGPQHSSMRVSEVQLSWTLSQETTIHTILIWHVATWFCGMAADDDQDCTKQLVFAERVFPSEHTFAARLSNYCAYLVAFRPELLPEHHALTASIFEEAARQALGFTSYASSADELYAWIKSRKLRIYCGSDKACFKQGIKLGQQLMRYSAAERWKVMAEFWAEMTLFVAQSWSADAHIERLATGGREFVTQLWAFLSNGWDRTFIRRDIDDDCMDLPAFEDIGRDILKKAAEFCQNN